MIKDVTLETIPALINELFNEINELKKIKPKPCLMNIGDAAEYIGVSRATFDKLRREGAVEPVNFPGCSPRYNSLDLNKYIENCKKILEVS
ncbi:MAG: helix-turn-helix domain-containing protein [Proteobacteria bacterium]|nr:helix-turn-helix domain-containing protein [Pseudomonadota bacterium]